MELTTVADRITDRIEKLNELEASYMEVIQAKVSSKAAYDREMAKTILRLKNGDIKEHDGQPVGATPVSIIEKLAKGICWEFGLASDLAESNFKALESKIDIARAQLNGYQSINRNLSE